MTPTLVATTTLEEELESLLDRERSSLRKLWTTSFLLLVVLVVALDVLLPLGPVGWGAGAIAALVAFLILQSSVNEYRAAHEAVARRLARR